jgi:hypothetical protein
MLTALASIVVFVTGVSGGSWWVIPLGTLFLLDRSWHAQHDYRKRFAPSLADDVLPFATMMAVLQAACTALGAFGMGRVAGLVLAG